MQLLSQQISAIERLKKYKVGALFMAPGTGKTLTAYNLSKSVDEVDYILWIVPFRTKENLKKEIEQYGNDTRIDIIGIESIGMSDRIYLEVLEKVKKHHAFIILDESIKIKNFDAKRTKRALEIARHAQYKLILNGTPLTKNLLDLWSQMEFLSSKILKMSLRKFKNTFCEWERIVQWNGGRREVFERIKKYHNLEYLYSLIDPYVYQCSLELSIEKNFYNRHYSITPEEYEKYHQIMDRFLSEENMERMNNKIFLQMTQLMQMSYALSPEKFEILRDIVSSHNPEKIIVFCKYIRSRVAVSQAFPEVTVLSYGMHAFGLNLQDKNIIVFFDKTFDYSQRIQSEFRTYRTGQNEDCRYYDLTANAPLDTLIDANIRKKISLSEAFKNLSIDTIKQRLGIQKMSIQPPKKE